MFIDSKHQIAYIWLKNSQALNQLPQITLLHGIHKNQWIVRILSPFNLNTFSTVINGLAYIGYSERMLLILNK